MALTYGSSGVGCLTPTHPYTKTLDTCLGKDQSFHKDTIYMIPRPNLGGRSIYTFCQVHPRSKHTSYKETTSATSVVRGACAHNHKSDRTKEYKVDLVSSKAY